MGVEAPQPAPPGPKPEPPPPPEWLTKETWQEFQASGLLWWVNRGLHLFGWAIAVEQDTETGEITAAYPCRCRFRGFDATAEEDGFRKVTGHLKDRINNLTDDCALPPPPPKKRRSQ